MAAYLRLGHGEDRSGGRNKPSVVSDALEALIGAIYLDGGLERARVFVREHVVSELERTVMAAEDKDFKTRLQEFVQKRHMGRLSYELLGATGPEHNKSFTMRVLLDDAEIGRGEGGTKQSAGQKAAERALDRFTHAEALPAEGMGPCD